jgi:hypothetical protein
MTLKPHHYQHLRKYNMQIIVKKITNSDLMRKACSYTINAESKMSLNTIYKCEHSPMRTQMFTVEMIDIPTFVSVHFVRHKHGVEHFVKSNREDRIGAIEDIGRMTPVNHLMLCNAQALINMARKRLCFKAHADTVAVMTKIKSEIVSVDSDLWNYMVPECVYRQGCNEIKTCGFWDKIKVRYDKIS